MQPKVYVTRRIPESGINLLQQSCDVEIWDSDDVVPRDVFLEAVADKDGVLCLLTDKVDAETLDVAKNAKIFANMAVGFDNIDVDECTKRGVMASNTPGVLTDTTADFAFTLLMAAARRIREGHEFVHAGKWETWGPLLLMGQDIHHATLGLIGLGRIGTEMARRGQGFSMRVIYNDVVRREDLEQELGLEYADFDTVLKESDFVSLHVPYMPATHHLISTEQLALMKESAILINTARGAIVDPQALYTALKSGEIWAAGLDVTEPEPIPMDDPLLTLDNCLIAPHIASASFNTRNDMSELAANNILAALSGKRPPTILNPEVLEDS
ncbi:MAG: D-glycerate dehydrogenase [Chloroflexota bacterium]|nr:D-glycerate dehydrogenase [Chloroflexota bacterium]MDE2930449.1 D-glycerate dehydrogenase [Chloroflexota bacterium]